MSDVLVDTPKSLRLPDFQARLMGRLREPHIEQLTAYVERIRRERQCGNAVPYFDPNDGGINAECLFVLEAPGQNAVRSGFISRNNPDESAKNWLELNREAGIPRGRTVSWNIVPWYIGNNGKLRPATRRDLEIGFTCLLELLQLLPRIKIVVLVGRKAQLMGSRLRMSRPDLRLMNTFHPSPNFINRDPGNKGELLRELRGVAAALDGIDRKSLTTRTTSRFGSKA